MTEADTQGDAAASPEARLVFAIFAQAIDDMGATKGSTVIITTDAKHGAELTGHKNSPVRFSVIGLPDERSKKSNTPTQKELFTWGA